MINATGGSSTTVGHNSARVRFSSVPNNVATCNNGEEVENTNKKDVCRYMEEGGKRLRLKSKEVVLAYAPIQWQPLLLDVVELLFRHTQKIISTFHRHFGQPWTLSSQNDSVATTMNHVSATTTTIGSAHEKAFRTAFVACLLILLCFFAYTFVLKIVIQFALPFYASFNAAYWFFQWRRKYDTSPSPPTSTTIGIHQQVQLVTDDVVKLIYFCCLADLAIIIFALFAIDSTSSYAQISLLHVLPLISYSTAKYIISPYLDSSSSIDDDTYLSFNNYYFVAFFAIRLFAYKGFVLVPWFLRPYFAYLSIYLALIAADRSASQHKLDVNNITTSVDVTLAGGRSISSSGGVSFCSHCTANQLLNSCKSQPIAASTHSPANLRPLKLIAPASDGDQYQKHSSMVRSSRRVSLPAGSLMPTKSQTNLNEARGMVAELLSQKDLPPNIVTGLKALITMLNPNQTVPTVYDLLANLPTLVDTPFIGEQLSADSMLTRRTSPVTWSTVTSATGLPTLEPEPNRPRSSSYWKQKQIEENALSPTIGFDLNVLKEQLCQKLSLESTDSLLQTPDGTLFDIEELESNEILSNLRQWSFLIFDLHAASPTTLISRVAYSTFRQSRLFNIFKIPRQKFFNFFHALEQGYWNIPYHNSIHASDVIHATFYFTTNPAPAVDLHADGLASVLSSLELLALYTAAGMHDYDHPGRTNAFLVATSDSKAILYNDRSVLENHHAASAWKLLSLPQNNFVENLDPAEYKRFRYIVMEAILATDLKRHFEILMEFNEKVGRGLDWENEADKLLVLQICIKMADINSPTKPFDLHIQWTNRILEEFYAQGDAEREQGLPVSAYMDRNEPQVAKLQDSFVAHLVKPLVQAMQTAGLLPVHSTSPDNDDDDDDDDDNVVADEPELIKYIEENHKYWKKELGEVEILPVDELNSPQVGEFDDEETEPDSSGEMETIEEDEDENV